MTVRNHKVDLKADPAVARELLKDGWIVAGEAAALAPKGTGAGAKSIRAEMAKDENGDPEARVSWDRDHFYMSFAEFGTVHQRATPFLRPVAFRYQ